MLRRATQGGPVGGAALFALLAVVVATASACQGPPARPRPWRHDPPDPPAAAPTEGSPQAIAQARADALERRAHALRIRLDSEPTNLNPLVDPDVDTLRVAEDTIFESLVRYDPGPDAAGPGVFRPGLAESWRVIGGGTEIDLVMRDGVSFHDGQRFTVVDAQYSIDMARSSTVHAQRTRDALADVMTVELAGPKVLRVTLRKQNAYVLRALAEIPILPEHVYQGVDLDRHPKNRAPIGTGPFRFVRWDKGQKILLARNETYWGPPPAIDEVEFDIEPDGARALMRARRGELDVLPALSSAHYPSQAKLMSDDFVEVRFRPAQLLYLVLNVTRPTFDDARTRQAVALLVDGKKLVDLHGGLVRRVGGPIWPGGLGDGPAGTALLDQAGWVAGADGVRQRAGVKLRVAFLATSDDHGAGERDLVRAALSKAGFVVEMLTGDPAVLLNRLKNGAFDLALIDWRGRTDEDLAPLFSVRGARNWGGYASRPMDALLATLESTWDPAARAAHLGDVAAVLASDWPIVPLWAPDPVGLVHKRVRGLVVRDGWFAIRNVSLDPKR
jgi:peptide/nickel transport system substrate-binding protein